MTHRILVVDDRDEMSELIAEALIERGYTAVALSSGRVAIARLEHEAFDAVVTDLRMPDVDGLRVLDASRALDPKRPVIVMTAHGAMATALEAVEHGAFYFLTKPFSLDALARVVARALGPCSTKSERSPGGG